MHSQQHYKYEPNGFLPVASVNENQTTPTTTPATTTMSGHFIPATAPHQQQQQQHLQFQQLPQQPRYHPSVGYLHGQQQQQQQQLHHSHHHQAHYGGGSQYASYGQQHGQHQHQHQGESDPLYSSLRVEALSPPLQYDSDNSTGYGQGGSGDSPTFAPLSVNLNSPMRLSIQDDYSSLDLSNVSISAVTLNSSATPPKISTLHIPPLATDVNAFTGPFSTWVGGAKSSSNPSSARGRGSSQERKHLYGSEETASYSPTHRMSGHHEQHQHHSQHQHQLRQHVAPVGLGEFSSSPVQQHQHQQNQHRAHHGRPQHGFHGHANHAHGYRGPNTSNNNLNNNNNNSGHSHLVSSHHPHHLNQHHPHHNHHHHQQQQQPRHAHAHAHQENSRDSTNRHSSSYHGAAASSSSSSHHHHPSHVNKSWRQKPHHESKNWFPNEPYDKDVMTSNTLFESLVFSLVSTQEQVNAVMRKAWDLSPQMAIKTLMYVRAVMKDDRCDNLVYALLWLRRSYPDLYVKNIEHFKAANMYIDLLLVSQHLSKNTDSNLDAPLGREDLVELEAIAEDIALDACVLRRNTSVEGEVPRFQPGQEPALTMAALHAPREKSVLDRDANLAKRIAHLMNPESKTPFKLYRDDVRVVRKYAKSIGLLDQLSQQQQGDSATSASASVSSSAASGSIDSKASRKNRGDTLESLVERVREVYQPAVQQSNRRLFSSPSAATSPSNASVSQANGELSVSASNSPRSAAASSKREKNMSRSVVVLDNCRLENFGAAAAFALLTCAVGPKGFKNRMLTFSENPEWIGVGRNRKLEDKVATLAAELHRAPAVRIPTVLSKILDDAVELGLQHTEMVERVWIVTDKPKKARTCTIAKGELARMRQRFLEAGYEMPQIIWWNVAGKPLPVPIRKSGGLLLINGYSSSLLHLFISDYGLHPDKFFDRAIGDFAAVTK